MSRALRFFSAAAVCALVAGATAPAAADHTDPNEQQARVIDLGDESTRSGEGTWTHIKNFGGTTGTDLEFFHRNGAMYVSAGQLGQAEQVSVGQRIYKLMDADGTVSPEWVADHGSASCGDVTNISATTGLQHDAQTTPKAVNILAPGPKPNGELVVDTVDALGRCHDKDGGGLEFIDVSGVGTEGFEPREVHLTRHTGYTHTVTVDATRPWIVYNSTSDFGTDPDQENDMGIGKSWIDVLDIRTCLGNSGKTLEQKRELCRPKAYRVPFDYKWSTQEKSNGTLRQPSACHDITARPGKIYCAALNATIVFDVAGLTQAQGPDVPAPTDPAGDIKGIPLPCEIKDPVPAAGVSPNSGAKVTDCTLGVPNDTVLAVDAWIEAGSPAAKGWKYLGHVNHPGRECRSPNGASTCNSNLETRADEGVAVSHEADPTPDGRWLFVTDERGGGIVPPGATCAPSLDNPYGNGGLHVFDMSKKDGKGRFEYAKKSDGKKAVYIARNTLPTATFCTIHVIEQIPDEQRIVAAWYTQGVKIIDYEIDAAGNWTFIERASFTLLPNDIWAAEVFKIQENDDGTRTYFMVGTDIGRGMDVFSWTGPKGTAIGSVKQPPKTSPPKKNPPQANPTPRRPLPTTGADLGLLALAGTAGSVALLVRRRRRSL